MEFREMARGQNDNSSPIDCINVREHSGEFAYSQIF